MNITRFNSPIKQTTNKNAVNNKAKNANNVNFRGVWKNEEKLVISQYTSTGYNCVPLSFHTGLSYEFGAVYHPFSWESNPNLISDAFIKVKTGYTNSKEISPAVVKSNHPDFVPKSFYNDKPELGIGKKLNREESLFEQATQFKSTLKENEEILDLPFYEKLIVYGPKQTNKIKESNTQLKSKIGWIEGEANTLKSERLKGELIDVSIKEDGLSPLENFLNKVSNNKSDTRWVEGKLMALPNATKRVADVVLESLGFGEKEASSLMSSSKERIIKEELKKSNFVETVLNGVKKLI